MDNEDREATGIGLLQDLLNAFDAREETIAAQDAQFVLDQLEKVRYERGILRAQRYSRSRGGK